MKLEEIKKTHEKYLKKYSLPSFTELNELFEIEKVKKSTETYIRSIRKILMEKVVNTLSFIEMLLNPLNAPRMYFMYIKSINMQDKADLEKIYKNFSELSVFSLERELSYNEKAEAELVKKVFTVWKSLSPEFERMLKKMKAPTAASQTSLTKKERDYFG